MRPERPRDEASALTLPPELLEACRRAQLRVHVVPFDSAEVVLTEPRFSIRNRTHLLLADKLSHERIEAEVRRSLKELEEAPVEE